MTLKLKWIENMRITYGGDPIDNRMEEHIYIMTRPGMAVDRQ